MRRDTYRCVGATLILMSAPWIWSGVIVLAATLACGLWGRADAELVTEPVIKIDYGQLIDNQADTHAQVPLGEILRRIDRQLKAGQAPESKELALVQPFLEPWAALLDDALVAKRSDLAKSELMEVAALFPRGSRQPAWVELFRSRRFYALSNGKGFVRVYVPGDSVDEAYEKHYSVLRHMFLFEAASADVKKLDVEVFAYQNNFAKRELSLCLVPKRCTPSAPFPPKAGKKELRLTDLDEFLGGNQLLEGAMLSPDGELTLIGAASNAKPTLMGHPISVADLAVAYRAVAHGEDGGEVYMSLDGSRTPGQTSVQFGGRLHDTRLGLVALLADMRFKTLANTYDPASMEFLEQKITDRVPGFIPLWTRVSIGGDRLEEEAISVRCWFYPDKVDLAVDQASRTIKVSRARFMAGMEQQVGLIGGLKAEVQPPALEKCLDNFNQNYDKFAAIFPEIGDLDSLARLLAVAAWLRSLTRESPVDPDSLLAANLPACPTPRHVSQHYIYERHDPAGGNPSAFRVNVTEQVQRGLLFQGGKLPRIASYWLIETTATAAGKSAYREAETKSRENFLRFKLEGVSTGGLNLDFVERLTKARGLQTAERQAIEQLRQSQAGERVQTAEGVELVQSGNGKGPPMPPTPRLSHAPGADDFGGHGAASRKPFGDAGYCEVAVSDEGRAESKLERIAPTKAESLAFAKSTYRRELGADAEFTMYEGERAVTYKLQQVPNSPIIKTVLLSTSERPAAGDARQVAEVLAAGNNSFTDAWNSLPDGTPITAIERMSDGRIGVLGWEEHGMKTMKLWVYNGQQLVSELDGQAALDAMRTDLHAKVANAGRGRIPFLSVTPGVGDSFRFQLGETDHEIPADELHQLMFGTAGSLKSLDALFGGPNAPKDVVLYRGPGTKRPVRLGGSLKAGASDDPLPLAARLQARFPEVKFSVDDDPDAAVRRALARVPVAGPNDLTLLVPDEASVGWFDYGVVKNLQTVWKQLNMPVRTHLEVNDSSRNVVILTAHNNAELFDLLWREGPALRGKSVLLVTCGEAVNANVVSAFMAQFDPASVMVFGERIELTAARRAIEKMAHLLAEQGADANPQDARTLFRRAVEEELKAIDVHPVLQYDEEYKAEFRKLLGAIDQLSLNDRAVEIAAESSKHAA